MGGVRWDIGKYGNSLAVRTKKSGPRQYCREGDAAALARPARRGAKKRKGLSAFQDVAVAHHNLAVGHFGQLVVVRHDDEGLAQLLAQ